MSDMVERITTVLEPILGDADPRRALSAYHDMPYALFQYAASEEFELRRQVTQLETRLINRGKRVHRISLAECLDQAMRSQHALADWFVMEREQGTATSIDTVHNLLAEDVPLSSLVAARMPPDADPLQDL